jgi:hypothetical protein
MLWKKLREMVPRTAESFNSQIPISNTQIQEPNFQESVQAHRSGRGVLS